MTPEEVAIEELAYQSVLDPQNMLYDSTNNHRELDRPNVPSREERCAKLRQLGLMIHKVRAALTALGRHIFGRGV